MASTRESGSAIGAIGAAVLLLAFALSGCTASAAPEPTPTRTGPVANTPEPEPTLLPRGSAEQNHEYFDHVNLELIESATELDGRALVENLVGAGFAKSAIEVTADKTPLGHDADSIQFSVAIGDECLIGQYGGTGYHSTIGKRLATGDCLLGRTQSTNW